MEPQSMNGMSQPNIQPEAPKKKGHGVLITLLIIIVLALIATTMLGKKDDGQIQDTSTETSSTQEASGDDLGSIEADLEATALEGVSDGL